MPNLKVVSFNIKDGSDGDSFAFQDADFGVNQLGWILISNSRREPVAAFAPGSIKRVVQVDESEAN